MALIGSALALKMADRVTSSVLVPQLERCAAELEESFDASQIDWTGLTTYLLTYQLTYLLLLTELGHRSVDAFRNSRRKVRPAGPSVLL